MRSVASGAVWNLCWTPNAILEQNITRCLIQVVGEVTGSHRKELQCGGKDRHRDEPACNDLYNDRCSSADDERRRDKQQNTDERLDDIESRASESNLRAGPDSCVERQCDGASYS